MKMMRYFDKGMLLFRLVLLTQLTFFATLGTAAPLRLEITEGVVEPLAFAAPDCPTGACVAGTMPVIQLEDAEIEILVTYLASLGAAATTVE